MNKFINSSKNGDELLFISNLAGRRAGRSQPAALAASAQGDAPVEAAKLGLTFDQYQEAPADQGWSAISRSADFGARLKGHAEVSLEKSHAFCQRNMYFRC